MKKHTFFLATFAAMIFAGCSSAKNLDGTWEACELTVNSQTVTGATAQVQIAKMSGNKFSFNGTSGVNSLSGTVTITKDGFKAADNFASTRMMGEPAAQTFEDNFLTILMNADSYTLENNVLVIKDSKTENCIKFTKKQG